MIPDLCDGCFCNALAADAGNCVTKRGERSSSAFRAVSEPKVRFEADGVAANFKLGSPVRLNSGFANAINYVPPSYIPKLFEKMFDRRQSPCEVGIGRLLIALPQGQE